MPPAVIDILHGLARLLIVYQKIQKINQKLQQTRDFGKRFRLVTTCIYMGYIHGVFTCNKRKKIFSISERSWFLIKILVFFKDLNFLALYIRLYETTIIFY